MPPRQMNCEFGCGCVMALLGKDPAYKKGDRMASFEGLRRLAAIAFGKMPAIVGKQVG